MKLAEVCRRLHEFPADDTIYTRPPWSPESEAIVTTEPDEGGLPAVAAERGLSYFIEVDLASEFLDDWRATQPNTVTDDEACRRLIAYAENDA